MEKYQTIVDPPQGWMYGFPKPIPDTVNTKEEYETWFANNGYPQALIDQGMLRYIRMWRGDPEQDTRSNP